MQTLHLCATYHAIHRFLVQFTLNILTYSIQRYIILPMEAAIAILYNYYIYVFFHILFSTQKLSLITLENLIVEGCLTFKFFL